MTDPIPRRVSRRSFLGRVSGGATLGGALLLVTGCAPGPANNVAQAGLTDCDTGPGADQRGQGRTGGRTGFSDQDSGASADRAGCGRPREGAPVTDSDRGRLADRAGHGRGPNGRYSDNDMGWTADPIGRGNRGRPPENGQ